MVDTLHGWAIGGASNLDLIHILRTGNGGLTWDDVTPPEPASSLFPDHPIRTFFMDASNAWAAYSRTEDGEEAFAIVVWHTEDAGDSWAEGDSFPLERAESISSPFQFSDLIKGWMMVGGPNPSLLRTADGGLSWFRVPVYQNTIGSQLDLCSGSPHVVFLDQRNGWLLQRCSELHGFRLHVTIDGGDVWRNIPFPPPEEQLRRDLPSASCQDETPALLGLGSGVLAFTCHDDAGREGGLLYRTENDGQTWEILQYPGGPIHFFDQEIGWTLGREIYKTTDGGGSWTQIKRVTWDGQFSFVDEQHGWAVARSGVQSSLVRTDDGARTWQELHPVVGGSLSLRSIEMVDPLLGWAMAGSSMEARHVLRTVDGGRTWQDVSPASPGGISDTWAVLDLHHVWVRVDGQQESVTLCRTHDGGEVWLCDNASGLSKLVHDEYEFISKIQFVDEWYGWVWAVGSPGAGSAPLSLFRTKDGGLTWRQLGDDPSGPALRISNALYATSFISPQSGWLLTGCFACAGFSLAHTENGGRTWVDVDLPPLPSDGGDLENDCASADGLEVLFSSPSSGVFSVRLWCEVQGIRMHKAFLYSTDDGGQTWTVGALPTLDPPDPSPDFYRRNADVYLATADIAWATIRDLYDSAGGGFVTVARWYRTTDGGTTWAEVGGIGEKEGYSDLLKLDFVDDSTGWALAEAPDESTGLFITQDGGLTWTELFPQSDH
jgi:photosystem II stability/assembly factor-like uncharacterized protein